MTLSRRSIPLLITLMAMTLAACSTNLPNRPMLAVLDRFSAADVPAQGPAESTRPTSLPWQPPAQIPTTLPGSQLAQHPFLYCGEGYSMIDVVAGGKVVWSYWCGKGGEIGDAWMLSNGNVLYTQSTHAAEITREKQVVWQYDFPAGTQCHSIQPIGPDKVLVMRNGLPPHLMLINIRTGAVEMDHILPAISATDPKTIHTQFRHVRMTREGTYLVSFLNMNKVVEYDKNWNEIFSMKYKSPWAALRLPSGNILVSGDHFGTLTEFDRTGHNVWQVTEHELPNVDLRVVQGVQYLSNGNVVICNSPGGRTRGDRTSAIQAVEVARDKHVVWVLQDWIDLGPASGIQLLDEPGIPENLELLR